MDMNEFRPAGPSAAQTKAPWQLELDAMNAVAKALEPLGNETRARVLRWLAARFVPEQAPANLAPLRAPASMATDNTGHGHVRSRPDGVRARCGGPGICLECSQEAGRAPGKVAP